MIDHVGFEVSDLHASAAFYDVVFYALGARRMHESEQAIAYGVNGPMFWIVVRGRAPGPGYGHILQYFVPRLRRLGMTEADVHHLLTTNPRTLFDTAQKEN